VNEQLPGKIPDFQCFCGSAGHQVVYMGVYEAGEVGGYFVLTCQNFLWQEREWHVLGSG
jgi:hypothetical protein